jgi:hypothetical protein
METEIGQELYDLSEDIRNDYPLTKYIIHLDQHVGDDTILRSIGDRIGMRIPETEYSINYLYTNLKKLLLKRHDSHVIYQIIEAKPTYTDEYFTRLYDFTHK